MNAPRHEKACPIAAIQTRLARRTVRVIRGHSRNWRVPPVPTFFTNPRSVHHLGILKETHLLPELFRLHCLLTEGTARYCEPVQRSKITAAIIDHFRIVEHAAKVAKVEVEPRILVVIEGLIRAGYLLKPQREDIGSSVPRDIKERFARVVGNKAPCPERPWWQVWK
jgi:hypothetical protein